VLEITAGSRLDVDARARIDRVLAAHLEPSLRRAVHHEIARVVPGAPRLVGWGAWCLVRTGELALAADLHANDVAPPAEVAAALTQSGVFRSVHCWSRDDATAIEMMMPLD
jgi:hypothetical protein